MISGKLKKINAAYQKILSDSIANSGGKLPLYLPNSSYSSSKLKKCRLAKIKKMWTDYLREKEKRDISFYLHIPFCHDRCFYCECKSEKLRRRNDLKNYADDLIRHFYYFKDVFLKSTFATLYIGGGTPSLLDEKLLEKLLKNLFRCFTFDKEGEKTSELNPLSSSLGKLKILKSFTFDRISFGVQSFHPEVLKINNRGYQTEEMVQRAVSDAIKAGFNHINLDLMLGLYGDNPKSFIKSFRKAARLKPYSISVYPFHPDGGYLEKFGLKGKDYYEKRANFISSSLEGIRKNSSQYGYSVPFEDFIMDNGASGAVVFYRQEAEIQRASKCYSFYKPREKESSVFGMGQFSYSKIIGKAHYQTGKMAKNPSLTECEVEPFSKANEMITRIINAIGFMTHFSNTYFREEFGESIFDVFKEPIESLKKNKLIEVRGNEIFFKLDDTKKKFYCSLFFLNEDQLFEITKKTRTIIVSDLKAFKRKNEKETLRILDKLDKFSGPKEVVDGKLLKITPSYVQIRESGVKKEFPLNNEVLFIELGHHASGVVYQKEIIKKEIETAADISLLVDREKDSVLAARKIISILEKV